MRTQRRAQQIESRLHIGDPIAHGFVDGVFERAAAAFHRDDFGAQQLHAEDIRLLPADIDGAHIDVAFQTQQRHGGRRADAMLPGAGFGDDAAFAHALGQ